MLNSLALKITADLCRPGDPSWILRAGSLLAQDVERKEGVLASVTSQAVHGSAFADLLHAAQDQSSRCSALPPEVIRQEIENTIMAPEPGFGLQWLYDTGVLKIWLPELAATVDFSQEAGRKHKDVWEHTKQVVFQAAPRPSVRWAALLHDIGKIPTRTFTADGKVHFHRHSEVGARMFEDVGKRLGLEKQIHKTLRFLILHHLRANQYVESWTDSAVRRFDREMDHHLGDLLDLSAADITSRRPGKRQQALASIRFLSDRIQKLRAEDAILPLLPSGIGNVIMERFHLSASRMVGELKRSLEVAIETGELEPRREAEYYLAHIERTLAEQPQQPCICQD